MRMTPLEEAGRPGRSAESDWESPAARAAERQEFPYRKTLGDVCLDEWQLVCTVLCSRLMSIDRLC